MTPRRLRVAADRRHLEYDDGTPFFYLADTAWELFHRLTVDEAGDYLRDRAAKGFTVIQAVCIGELGGADVPNPGGHTPLHDLDPTRPNEAYFRDVDAVVKIAADLGLVVGMLPTWGRYWVEGPGRIFSSANAHAYGQFLGARYREAPIIWILGGDRSIGGDRSADGGDERATVDAMAAGLAAGDGGAHLRTFHPCGPGLSSVHLHTAPWLDFNMSQSSHAARHHDTGLYIEHDYALSPPKPTLDGEPRYEQIAVGFYLAGHSDLDRFNDADVRQAAWWAVLAGAAGHTYGNNNIWQMWAPGRPPILSANIPWRTALDHPGAFQMGHLRRFMEALPFHKLVPDQRLILDGPAHGGAKIRAARASDHSYVVVYSPQGAPFTLDKRTVDAVRVHESWFDPRYGVHYRLHTADRYGIQTYTPPSTGLGHDWVLTLAAGPRT